MMTYEDKVEASVRLVIRNTYERIIHTHNDIRKNCPWLYYMLTWHLRYRFRKELRKNYELRQRCQQVGINYRDICRQETPWPK